MIAIGGSNVKFFSSKATPSWVSRSPASDGAGRRLAELEERLAVSEKRADILQHEVGRLRRELPRETHGAR